MYGGSENESSWDEEEDQMERTINHNAAPARQSCFDKKADAKIPTSTYGCEGRDYRNYIIEIIRYQQEFLS